MGGAMTERKSRAHGPEPAPRGRGARRVSELLPRVGGAAFRRFGFVQSAVVSRWPEIVGERYAARSSPESIRFPAGTRKEGVLTLLVAGAHAPMMQHLAPTIVERVNLFFGYPAVARVVMRQGVMPGPAPRPGPRGLRPVAADIGDSLRGIADPELRACLAALAGAVEQARTIPVLGKVS